MSNFDKVSLWPCLPQLRADLLITGLRIQVPIFFTIPTLIDLHHQSKLDQHVKFIS